MARLIGYTTLAAAASVLLWWAALAAYDRYAIPVAVGHLQALAGGKSGFEWVFDGPESLAYRGVHDLTEPVFDAAGMRVQPLGDAPYLKLDFDNRLLDAKRFHAVVLRYYSGATGRLRLQHGVPFRRYVNLSAEIPIQVGWQTLRLDLAELNWQRIFKPEHPPPPGTVYRTRWGDDRALVDDLYLIPTLDAPAELIFDYLRFEASPPRPWPKLRSEPLRLSLYEQVPAGADFVIWRLDWKNAWSWFKAREDESLVAEDIARLRTPELSHWRLLKAQAVAPNAVILPRSLDIRRLRASPPNIRPLGARLAEAELDRWIAALLILLLFLAWRRGRDYRERIGVGGRAALELAFLLPLAALFLLLIPRVQDEPSGYLMWLGLLGLCVVLNRSWRADWRTFVGPSQVWWLTLLFSLPWVVLTFWMGWRFDTWDNVTWQSWAISFVEYPPWALLQQFLLGPVFARRFEDMLGDRGLAVLCAATVFGFLHFPNFGLMAPTFIIGIVWAWLYLRYRALLPLALAHGWLATLYGDLAPDFIRVSSKVGEGYFRTLGLL